MKRKTPHYTLQFVFDGTQLSSPELKESAEEALKSHLRYITLNVGTILPSKGKMLTVTGSLKVVDKCHDKINKVLLPQYNYRAVRWKDEASEKVRRDVYPIVARIEQGLRLFISRAMLEIIGFDWWETWAPAKIQDYVKAIHKRDKSYYETLHPLEMTQFEDLVELITAKVARWEDRKPIPLTEITELLTNSNTIEEARAKFQQNANELSLWDDVFAKYFRDDKQWKGLVSSIRCAIVERHKTMHHQPMRYGIVKVLKQLEKDLDAVLGVAKKELSKTERREAEQNFKVIDYAFQRILDEMAQSPVFDAVAATQIEIDNIHLALDGLGGYSAIQSQAADMMRIFDGLGGAAALQDQTNHIQRILDQIVESPIFDAVTAAKIGIDNIQRIQDQIAQSSMFSVMEATQSQTTAIKRMLDGLGGAAAIEDQMGKIQRSLDQVMQSPVLDAAMAAQSQTTAIKRMLDGLGGAAIKSQIGLTQRMPQQLKGLPKPASNEEVDVNVDGD